MRDRVAGEPDERVDDLLGIVTGGTGVPQRQRGDPVGVDMLGGTFQLGKRGDRGTRLAGLRMVDLKEQGLVRLDDQRPVGHLSPSFRGDIHRPYHPIWRRPSPRRRPSRQIGNVFRLQRLQGVLSFLTWY